MTREGLGEHVRPIRIPDLEMRRGLTEDELRRAALAGVDAAIASLKAAGIGLSAVLFDPLFSTEGLTGPRGYVAGLADRVHAAGGLVIADEVQSGFGRTGDACGDRAARHRPGPRHPG